MESRKKPIFLDYRSSRSLILTTVSLAVFIDIFLYGVIIPIAPYVVQYRIKVPPGQVQRDVTYSIVAYAAGLLVGSPVIGYLTDIFQNRRYFMLTGLVALLLSTVLLCLTKALWLFILGRVFAGVSAAVTWSVGLALLTDSFPGDQMGKTMGVVSTGTGLGGFLGPLLGGVLYAKTGYYSVFAVVFAFISVDLFFRLILLERKDLKKYENTPDLVAEDGAIDITEVAEESGIDSTDAVRESKRTHDINAGEVEEQRPQRKRSWSSSSFLLLKDPRMLNSLFVTVATGWVMSGIEAILPLRVEQIFQFDSLGAGLLFLPIALTSLLGAVTGSWIDKKGCRMPLVLGLGLGCPVLIALRFPTENTIGHKVLLFALMALFGLVMALLLPGCMSELSLCVMAIEEKNPGCFGKGGAFGQAFGLFNVAYSLGTFIGPLEAGFVVDSHGFATACWTLGLILFVTAIPAALLANGYLFAKKDGENDTSMAEEKPMDPTMDGVELAAVQVAN
ncbi:major facilitator superfamily domain-containing protein [Lipomyces kononenkoae]|uniref:Major facilitator superfamily domain-containing protein n=1 Tax=Lipomyces kononenkoae TaxID=34357 RepID=A0ACC3SST6_LIPKO